MSKTLSHSCDKSADLAILQEQVNDLTHIIKDNGQPGLATTVIKLVGVTERLCEDVNSLRTVVSGFEKFMAGVDASKHNRQWVLTLVSSIATILISTIIVLWGTGVFKN